MTLKLMFHPNEPPREFEDVGEWLGSLRYKSKALAKEAHSRWWADQKPLVLEAPIPDDVRAKVIAAVESGVWPSAKTKRATRVKAEHLPALTPPAPDDVKGGIPLSFAQAFFSPIVIEFMAAARDPQAWERSLTHPDEHEDAEAWRQNQVAAMRAALKAVGLA